MLEHMATVGEESIVSWQPHGKAFRVHRPDLFAQTVMPRYFKQTKYKSFQRQLHIYGFHRIGKGMDRGAYCHSMFMRNKKSMSLRMSCQKVKGGKSSTSNAAVDPDFYSSEANVLDNEQQQYQDRRNRSTNVLQSDPILLHLQACTTTTTTKEKKRRGCTGSTKRGQATVFTAGSRDRQPDEEKPLLNSSALLFNQEVAGAAVPSPSSSSRQQSSIDWMLHVEQAQTTLSPDEEQASPYHGYESSSSEKGHEVSALLRGVNHQKHDNEGFFAGRKFYYVVETRTPMVEDFSAVVERGRPMFFMPRSA
jgi:hypothetical protein